MKKISVKNTQGLSYIEVIIGMALFAIALLAIIPTLSQAGRNMTFAQESYIGHLQAQRVMLVIRDALANDVDPIERAVYNFANDFDFSFWIVGQNPREFHSIDVPYVDIEISGISTTMASHASIIVAIVWSEDKQVIGRAIGMSY